MGHGRRLSPGFEITRWFLFLLLGALVIQGCGGGGNLADGGQPMGGPLQQGGSLLLRISHAQGRVDGPGPLQVSPSPSPSPGTPVYRYVIDLLNPQTRMPVHASTNVNLAQASQPVTISGIVPGTHLLVIQAYNEAGDLIGYSESVVSIEVGRVAQANPVVGPPTPSPCPSVSPSPSPSPSPPGPGIIFELLPGKGVQRFNPDVSVGSNNTFVVSTSVFAVTGPYGYLGPYSGFDLNTGPYGPYAATVVGAGRFTAADFSGAPTPLDGPYGLPVSAIPTRGANNSSVAVHPANNFDVGWDQYGQVGIFGQTFDASGNPLLVTPYGPIDSIGPYGVGPDMTVAGSDQVITCLVNSSGASTAYTSRMALGPYGYSDLPGWPGQDFFTSGTANAFTGQAVAAAPDAARVVNIWSESPTGGGVNVFGLVRDSGGLPVGPKFQVNHFTGGATTGSSGAAVAMFPDKSFCVVFERNREIYGRYYDLDGNPLTGYEFQIALSGLYPHVAPDPTHGAALVTWAVVSHSGSDIAFQSWTFPGGTSMGEAINVSGGTPFGTDHFRPRVATKDTGDAVVVWHSQDHATGAVKAFGRLIPAPPSRTVGASGRRCPGRGPAPAP